MNFKKNADTIIFNLKHAIPSNIPTVIPVSNETGHIANLRVITKKQLEQDDTIALLTKWRISNQDAFPSQFKVTHEGTKRWAKVALLDLPDRILFFLETLDGKPYAHIGLYRFNYKEQSCEIDNVIRGLKVNPGSMTNALEAFSEWTFKYFKIKTLYLQVFADNTRAIKLYKRCRFNEMKKIPLKKITEPGVIRFIDLPDKKEKPDRYFLLMKRDPKKKSKYEQISEEVRKQILLMSYRAQSAHVGGALSCVELLVALYFDVMKTFPQDPYNDKRDRFFFSKAHDAKALYAVLAERGFFSKKIMEGYEMNGGLLPGHSTRHCVPGVEISAGALGHGLSIAVGSAFAGKSDKKKHKVYAMISDGECDEGSTWEAALFAGAHKLDNLITIIDYNKLQGFGFTKDILDLEPFAKKWESFGWAVKEIDGHNFPTIINTLKSAPFEKGKPSIIIAHTIKGLGGVAKHVNQISSQYKPPSKEDIKTLVDDLQGEDEL